MSEFLEALWKLVEGGFGFRFLFSKSYRNETIQRWKGQSKLATGLEIFETIIGMVFLIIILVVAVEIISSN